MDKGITVWSGIGASLAFTIFVLTTFIIPSIATLQDTQQRHITMDSHTGTKIQLESINKLVDTMIVAQRDNSKDIDQIKTDTAWIRGFLEKSKP